MDRTNDEKDKIIYENTVYAGAADVHFHDQFWKPRQDINRKITLMHVYRFMEEDNRLAVYDQPKDRLQQIDYKMYWESELAKWIEAACYCMKQEWDQDLAALLDEVIAKIVSVQQSDGYLNAFISMYHPEERWQYLFICHELFNAGTLIEAAIAHKKITGKNNLYDPVCRYADLICNVFGSGEGQIKGYCGHAGVEMALIGLYHYTGLDRYLNTARFFINQRGTKPFYYDQENILRGIEHRWVNSLKRYYDQNGKNLYEFNQSHRPVREQSEAVGHAVRATFLYNAMAQLGLIDEDGPLISACQKLYSDITEKKMYITGGVGSVNYIEGFGDAYDLPNRTAYAETCAAVGLIYFCFSMLNISCHSRYADVIEKIIYNTLPAGVSLDGRHFFYENVLTSFGEHKRFDRITCACCPPNILKLLATIGRYFYMADDNQLIVHQYAACSSNFSMQGKIINIEQKTDYPWDGHVRILVDCPEKMDFCIKLRLPGWCNEYSIKINGQKIEHPEIVNGYCLISRTWSSEDYVELDMPMPVQKMWSHPQIRENACTVALQRGPIVYCFESFDLPGDKMNVRLKADSICHTKSIYDEWGHWIQLNCAGEINVNTDDSHPLYATNAPAYAPCTLKAIPYCLWNNRGQGEMRVWLKTF